MGTAVIALTLFLKLSKNAAPIKGECDDQNFVGMSHVAVVRDGGPVAAEPSVRTGRFVGADELDGAGVADACSFNVKKAPRFRIRPTCFSTTPMRTTGERRSSCLLRATVYFQFEKAALAELWRRPRMPSASSCSIFMPRPSFLALPAWTSSMRGRRGAADEDAMPDIDGKHKPDRTGVTFDTSRRRLPEMPARVGWDFVFRPGLL